MPRIIQAVAVITCMCAADNDVLVADIVNRLKADGFDSTERHLAISMYLFGV